MRLHSLNLRAEGYFMGERREVGNGVTDSKEVQTAEHIAQGNLIYWSRSDQVQISKMDSEFRLKEKKYCQLEDKTEGSVIK